MSTTLQTYFTQVSQVFAEDVAIWTPGWWYLTINKAVTQLSTEEPSATDMFHYQNLKTLIHKVTRAWSNCYKNWAVDSLESLLAKAGVMLASTFKPTFFESKLVVLHYSSNRF